MTLHVTCFSGDRQLLAEQEIPIALGTDWRQGAANVSAPAGTASVNLEVTSSTGRVGDIVYLDDFVVGDAAP